jgi:maleate isomerase
MIQSDNWGWRARIGLFIVSSEAVPEAEWWAMVPTGVSVHAARIAAPAPWAQWINGDRRAVTLADDFKRGAEHFANMRLNAVVVGHSSSSILGGPGWDQAVVAALRELLPAETHVTTNGFDCIAASSASQVQRPYLVFPPWFNDSVVSAGVQYFADQGLDSAGHMRADPGRGWRDLAPSELYPRGIGFAQDVESLYRQIRNTCPDDADGVLIAGTGFRCVGICDDLEHDLNRPVITANQASLWHCLTLAGIRPDVDGYGALLARF